MEFALTDEYALNHGIEYAAVRSVLERHGMPWVSRFEPGELQLHEEIHLAPDHEAAVRYVYDHFVGIAVVRFEADDAARLGPWMARITPELEVFDRITLHDLARGEDVVEKSFGLRGLAATVHDHWLSAYLAVESALDDPRPDIRRIALLAMSRMGWKEFVPVLEQRLPVEEVEAVRTEIQTLLTGLALHGKSLALDRQQP